MSIVLDARAKRGTSMETKELLQLLANRYKGEAYAFLENVRNGTGYGARDGVRTADALAMSLWPSRGLHLSGFELKVSRNDWLHELKQPSKADAIAKYCDFWYLVISDIKIIQPGELPPTWGLLVASNTTLKQVTAPTLLEAEPLSKLFLASILRKITATYLPPSVVDNRVDERIEREKQQWENNRSYHEQEAEKLWERVRIFEEASGINLEYQWQKPKEIGEAVRTILDGKYKRDIRQLENLEESAKRLHDNAKEELAKFRKLEQSFRTGLEVSEEEVNAT